MRLAVDQKKKAMVSYFRDAEISHPFAYKILVNNLKKSIDASKIEDKGICGRNFKIIIRLIGIPY